VIPELDIARLGDKALHRIWRRRDDPREVKFDLLAKNVKQKRRSNCKVPTPKAARLTQKPMELFEADFCIHLGALATAPL
jgi:hypothetical protein